MQLKPRPAGLSLRAFLEKDWIRCFFLAAIGFVVRAPALQGQLIWDDQYLARDNPFIKSPWLALEAFRHYLFLDSFSGHYRPVQNISFMFDYVFWNASAFGFHLTNVLLHVVSGILLYFLVRKLLDSLGRNDIPGSDKPSKIDNAVVALLVAAAWLVHPVHSAAVDYISGRADSLAFLFACGGWLFFLKAREVRPTWARILLYTSASASGLLALCSRESACIWFAIFILYVCFFQPTSSRKTKMLAVIGCIAALSLYAGLRQLPTQRVTRGPSMDWSRPVRAMLILRALGDYGRLMIFPSNLHMERTVFDGSAFYSPQAREHSIELEYLSIGGFGLLVFLGALASRRGRGQRLRLFGALWFIAAFLPISNLFDLNATVAEHWLYLPSAGFLIFLAGCVVDLPGRYRRAAFASAGIAVIALGVRSSIRSSDWVDAATFYERTSVAGGTSCRVNLNLGQIYAGRGDYEKAEKIFRNIIRIQPDYTIARNNLADVLAHLGREKEAEQLLADATQGAHQSMKDYPRTWVAALNLARMLHARHDETAALAVLEKARVDYPQTWELISSESELLRQTNKLDQSITLIRTYAEQNWWHYGSWLALGRVLAEKGDVDLAESALRHASWLDVRSTEALNFIAVMRMGQNRFDDAWQMQRRAVARQPDEPRQYVLLSNILDKMGRPDEARAALAQITRLRDLADSEKVAN